MRVLDQFASGPETCQYLPDRLATQEYVLVSQLPPEEYEALMNRGWRKFGPQLFRPICNGCRECRPIRIDAEAFAPDRSQRRAFGRNEDLTVRLDPPTVDAARMDLFRRYHTEQAALKGWPDSERTAEAYAFQFVHNPVPAIEISIWEGGVLRAIALTDVTPNVVSGVYHYHDPDCRERSLGTFVMGQTIALAQKLRRRWAYFGFYVAGCGSMAYKARFQPCEILDGEGVWRPQSGYNKNTSSP